MLPPVVAIAVAILSGRVVWGLVLSVFAGAVILYWPHPVRITVATAEEFLWAALAQEDFLRIAVFTSLMGGMVGLMHRGGGMQALVELLTRRIRSRRGGQLAGWVLGLVVFFDDYANTLLLGTTLAPWYDRLRISREKLAYIVDSTAAPVAGLALVSTWVAAEVGYMSQGLAGLKFAQGYLPNPFDLFVQTIPYRFYPLLALVLVGLVAWSTRDWGRMLRAEQSALSGSDNLPPEGSAPAPHTSGPEPRWYNALVPVLVVLGLTLLLLAWTGWYRLPPAQRGTASWWECIRQGDAYASLVYAALGGLVCAWTMLRIQRLLSAQACAQAAVEGAFQVAPALVILWLASALRLVTDAEHLNTGGYLARLLQTHLPVSWLPTVVFLLAAGVSFATGTSWGTMGILMPLVIPTAHALLAAEGTLPTGQESVFLASVAGVLAGSIFGDHCSPISDTTVLASLASGCPHMQHVWTQLPYAVFTAVVSVLFGTLPSGWGVSPWWGLALGSAALAAGVFLLGRKAHEEPAS